MNEFRYKDRILYELKIMDNGHVPNLSSEELAVRLSLYDYQAVYLIDKLEEDGLVYSVSTSGMKTSLSGRIVRIEQKGLAFLDFGGFKRISQKESRLKYWSILKICAAVLNSALVIAIAAWGLYIQSKANEKQESIEFRRELREWGQLLLNAVEVKNNTPAKNDSLPSNPQSTNKNLEK